MSYAVANPSMAVNRESKFTGGAISNFLHALAVTVVSIITLGLAYPAMVCWKLRWESSHTCIDGRQLVFDGTGLQLFGKYIVWFLLSIITFGIYFIFCMPLNMTRWTTEHTHFENGTGSSSFDGHIWQLFGVRFLSSFISLITFGLGTFWAHCYQERWYNKHTVLDGVRMSFDGTAWQYFGKRIVWLLLTVITLGIYSFWLAVRTKQWTIYHTHGVTAIC